MSPYLCKEEIKLNTIFAFNLLVKVRLFKMRERFAVTLKKNVWSMDKIHRCVGAGPSIIDAKGFNRPLISLDHC